MKNRIVEHRRVRASELKPHPLNWREHPKSQQQALKAILEEVGVARSLLCYVAEEDRGRRTGREVQEGFLLDEPAPEPLTLIDGHLRADLNPQEMVDVEILDVDDEEARKLLFTLDPLTELAKPNQDIVRNLLAITTSESEYLTQLWGRVALATQQSKEALAAVPQRLFENHFLVLITCNGEEQQLELLKEMKSRNLEVKAVIG